MPSAADLESHVGELLRSEMNDADDAVTTRERMRRARREEVKAKYERSLPTRLMRDQSRAVVCNRYHQQLDVAPSEVNHPLVDNLLHGRYYEAKDPTPDLEKPHGLGRRVESSIPAVPSAAVPLSPEQRRAAEVNEKERLAEMRAAADRLPTGNVYVRPFPQDDAHDHWGRKVDRPKSAAARARDLTFQQLIGQPEPPAPKGLADPPVGPIPGFDMAVAAADAHPCDPADPAEFQKPTSVQPDHMRKMQPPREPHMVTRQTETSQPDVRSRAPVVAADRPVSARLERPSTAAHIAAREPARGVLPQRRPEPTPRPDSARFRSRPTDTLMALF